ncbi:hypothetical protein LPB136_06390 [Tenacibaculum todarodis]|uniref:Thioredoxin domain-containing protein n=2 Tax=Tenacibaculum todarodis TaxID=1850252 RepID=A0A1L3JIN7_9FLAO|nr:hypothetical protein LPB136_06390 [Tenacibaculum todarodis]
MINGIFFDTFGKRKLFIMRKIYLTSLILFLGFSFANAQESVDTQEVIEVQEILEPEIVINWEKSYDDALKRAKAENKPLLVYFTGSDWCGPCKVLGKKLFKTEKFQEYATNKFVLYKADFPRNKDLVEEKTRKINEEIQARFGQSKFPTMLIVNSKEQELGIKQGMYMTEYYYPFFDKAIRAF